MTEKKIQEAAEKAYPLPDKSGSDIYNENNLKEYCQDAFIAGANWALENRWVKCSDRMPDDFQDVIVICQNHMIVTCTYRPLFKSFQVLCTAMDVPHNNPATHWMSLPTPPKP